MTLAAFFKFAASLFRRLSRVLFINNDTPQRIAAGIGVGVFTGMMPGIGPGIALLLAALLRINKAGAVAGSVITNTWISFLALLPAVKTGAAVFGADWRDLRQAWTGLINAFNWDRFLASFCAIFIPVAAGYLIIAVVCGIAAYLAALWCIFVYRKLSKKRGKWYG